MLDGKVKKMDLLRIKVIEARNLLAAETTWLGRQAKSDPFVKVYWCNHKVGQTEVCSQDLDPKWFKNVEHRFNLPHAGAGCELRLEIFDHDMVSFSDFLGQIVLAGEELCKKEWRRDEGSENVFSYKEEFRLQKRADGTEMRQQYVNDETGALILEMEIVPNGSDEGAHGISDMAQQSLLDEENIAKEIQPENKLLVHVVDAVGLRAADMRMGPLGGGASDPYVKVLWNNKMQELRLLDGSKKKSKTAVIKQTLNPVWDNEQFQIPLGMLYLCAALLLSF